MQTTINTQPRRLRRELRIARARHVARPHSWTKHRSCGPTRSSLATSASIAGLFVFGSFAAEVPSNLFMMRVGAGLRVARIMIAWGLVSAATAVQVSITRFLLGLGEAGFVPGVFLYLGL